MMQSEALGDCVEGGDCGYFVYSIYFLLRVNSLLDVMIDILF